MGQPYNPKLNGSGFDGPLDTDSSGISLKKINKILAQGITVDGSDIQLGAVEIKDGASDNRATVNASGQLLTANTPIAYTASSNAAVQTAAGTVGTLAASQSLFIQNLGTSTIKVKYGASASTSSYNFILAGGIAQDDGTGASASISDWVGAISVFGDAAIRYNSTVLS